MFLGIYRCSYVLLIRMGRTDVAYCSGRDAKYCVSTSAIMVCRKTRDFAIQLPGHCDMPDGRDAKYCVSTSAIMVCRKTRDFAVQFPGHCDMPDGRDAKYCVSTPATASSPAIAVLR